MIKLATSLDGFRKLSAAIIQKALEDLSEPKYMRDAASFLCSEYYHTLLSFVGSKSSISLVKLNRYIALASDINRQLLYQIRQYARGHTLKETAEHFEILKEDMECYAEWQNIKFIQ